MAGPTASPRSTRSNTKLGKFHFYTNHGCNEWFYGLKQVRPWCIFAGKYQFFEEIKHYHLSIQSRKRLRYASQANKNQSWTNDWFLDSPRLLDSCPLPMASVKVPIIRKSLPFRRGMEISFKGKPKCSRSPGLTDWRIDNLNPWSLVVQTLKSTNCLQKRCLHLQVFLRDGPPQTLPNLEMHSISLPKHLAHQPLKTQITKLPKSCAAAFPHL